MNVVSAAGRTGSALRDAVRDARSAWRPQAWLAIGAFAVAAAAPATPWLDATRGAGWLDLALAGVALAFVVGPGGLPSLGHGAFMAVGAFASALLRAKAGWPIAPAIGVAVMAAGTAGLLAGASLVRLRPAFVAVSTWILAWLVALGLAAFPSISGGSQGLVLPTALDPVAHYELALALVGMAMLGFVALRRAPAGLRLSAAARHPAAAAALGVPAGSLRVQAFVGSAAIAGLAGALAVDATGVADPTDFGPFLSFKLLIAVLLGGAASALGAPVGLAVFGLLAAAAHAVGSIEGADTARFDPMLASMLVLSVLAAGSDGVVPEIRRRLRPATRPEPPAAGIRRVQLPPPDRLGLVATGLTKRLGGSTVLDGLSLELRAGEVAALVGPNGSGKTTALRLISGTLPPDGGRVHLDGGDVTGLPPRRLAELGLIRTLQSTALFDGLTALENALVGAAVRRRDAGALRALFATPRARHAAASARAGALVGLARVGLGWAAQLLAEELAAGDRRRLMLACALAAQPRVLLLDEPSAGAAPEDVDRLAAILAELRADGLALLVVEHNVGLVSRIADRVVVLDAGLVVAEGTPDEVAADPAVRRAYLGGSGA